MKKKVLALIMLVVILAVAATGATLAYFTDTDEATNVFTVGDIEVEIVEKMQADDGSFVDWQSSTLPLVDPQQGPFPLNKLVMVKNTGTNDAYIRLHIKYEAAIDPVVVAVPGFLGGTNIISKPANVTENGINYVVYTIEITSPVKAGYYFPHTLGTKADADPSDFSTCIKHALVQGIALDNSFDWENKDYGWFSYGSNGNRTVVIGETAPDFTVYVTAEAIQAQPFKNAKEAFAALDAELAK